MRETLDDAIGTHPRGGENHVDARLAYGSSRRIGIADRATLVVLLRELSGIVNERLASLVPALPAFVVYAEVCVALVIADNVIAIDDQDLAALHCLIHS